jgi:hypothetical protein
MTRMPLLFHVSLIFLGVASCALSLTTPSCRDRYCYSPRRTNVQQRRLSTRRSLLTSLKSSILVDELFLAVEQAEAATTTASTTTATPEINQTTIIPSLIQQLENVFQAAAPNNNKKNKDADALSLSRFDPLVGYYNVTYTLTSRAKDNPVGGKWTRSSGLAQKLLQTRRTLQHILPLNRTGLVQDPLAVAEAVNVIIFDALFGLVQLTVILRGDAVPVPLVSPITTTETKNEPVPPIGASGGKKGGLLKKPLLPLSNLAVRAYFDPPRIVLGKSGRFVNLAVGPTSSVVLDTTYNDDRLRIGMGGTSGTKFVFARLKEQDEEARAFLALLQKKPTSKVKAAAVLLSVAAAGVCCCRGGGAGGGLLMKKMFGGLIATVSTLLLALILSSGGGIERREDTYQPGK